MLSDADSDVEEDHRLVINEHYAKAFQQRKDREELQNLKDKYGSDIDGDATGSDISDSESDYSEDEDGDELTPAVDAAILRTLARIKRKDPEIYKTNTNIFHDEHGKIQFAPTHNKTSTSLTKSLSVRDATLQSVLGVAPSRSPSPPPTFAEEQATLRNDTIAAFNAIQPKVNSDFDSDNFFTTREKTKDEVQQEEEDYRAFLEREVGPDIRQIVTLDSPQINNALPTDEGTPPSRLKKKPKLRDSKDQGSADKEFLMNYIFNRGWIDRSSKRIPTYHELTSSKTLDTREDRSDHDSAALDSDQFDEVAEDFEKSYNFRFEEPDADRVKTYPRNVLSTVRREETTRKDARERKKQRKEEQTQQKKEEIKRLKALKMAELREKLQKIGQEGGFDDAWVDDPATQGLDLDGDWDPEQHDAQMAGLYRSQGLKDDTEKPTWAEDIDLGDVAVLEDGGVDVDAMDADVDLSDVPWDGSEDMRKKLVQKYMGEIDALDFNDMVGNLPTRFNYTAVEPDAFSLTPAEILLATDKELNEYRSIKKYAPYRTRKTKWDPKKGEKLKELKKQVASRAPHDWLPAEVARSRKQEGKKRIGKKERQRLKVGQIEGAAKGESDELTGGKRARAETPDEEIPIQKKRKRRKKNKGVS